MFHGTMRVLMAALVGLIVSAAVLTVIVDVLALLLPLMFLAVPALFLYGAWRSCGKHERRSHQRRQARASPPQSRPFSRRHRAGPPQQDADAWVREAQQAAREIAALVRRGDRTTRQALSGVPASAGKLADRVRDLARSCAALDDHLRNHDPDQFARKAADMEHLANTATDPFAREQYLAAARSLQQQAAVCTDLSRTRERLRAEIAHVLAALSGLRSRIVAAQSGAAAGAGSVDGAADELADLHAQVDTFQESVRQVLQRAAR